MILLAEFELYLTVSVQGVPPDSTLNYTAALILCCVLGMILYRLELCELII